MQFFLLQFGPNLPLRSYRKSASKPRVSTTRDMKNKMNLHSPKKEAVLVGDIQVPVGNNKAVRKPQLPRSFPRFIPVLGLIKSRGQSAKATEQAGTAEVLFQRESKGSKAKRRGSVLQSRANSTILTTTPQSIGALVPGDCCQ